MEMIYTLFFPIPFLLSVIYYEIKLGKTKNFKIRNYFHSLLLSLSIKKIQYLSYIHVYMYIQP